VLQRAHASLPAVTVLREHPELRALVERIARRVLAAVQPESVAAQPIVATPGQDAAEPSTVNAPVRPESDDVTEPLAALDRPSESSPERFEREVPLGLLGVEWGAVSRRLYARLSAADVASIERLLRETPGAWDHYAAAIGNDLASQQLLLALGLWLAAPEIPAQTGLVKAEPPDDVHSMTRGALAAAGGLYEADLIVDALATVGDDPLSLAAVLDFGCSSGRVLRPLAAAYPDTRWIGCDPNEPAIAWASEHFPGIEFFVNGHEPPLPLRDAALDMAYAISIWSHFEPELGLRWFEEMRRLIRPGGYLVFTTHGVTSVAFYATRGLRTPEQSAETAEGLYRRGWWYAEQFGEEGDWGVVNPGWGTAFLSPEWVLAQLCPRWRVLEFAPGRNQENQDVYVLQRV
jgi:SAM-dependent methyltransferase